MTDIEKKTYKVTLIRGFAICISLIACTWKLSGSFSEVSSEFYGLKSSINVLVVNVNELTKKDSINKAEIAQLQLKVAHQGHDLDSLKKVHRVLVVKSGIKARLTYYTQRRVNGKLITEALTNPPPQPRQ